MTTWTAEELALIDASDELGIASQRPDGSMRPYVTIWFALSGDTLYVRSAYGYDNPWFQRALRSGEGRIRVGGLERDVTFEPPGAEVSDVVSARNGSWRSTRARHGKRVDLRVPQWPPVRLLV